MPHVRITASEPQPMTQASAPTTPRIALPPSIGSDVADQPVATMAARATSRAAIWRGAMRSFKRMKANRVPSAG